MPKKDDATQNTGVSDAKDDAAGAKTDESGEQKERQKSDRELGMEMMEQRRREALAAEGVALEPVDSTAAATAAADAQAAAAEAQITAQTDDERAAKEAEAKAAEEQAAKARASEEAAAAGTTSDDRIVMVEGRQMVKTKVDGVEALEPLDKVLANYQKGNAADKRLEEATRLLEEAKQTAATATTAKDKKEAEAAVEAAKTNLQQQRAKFFDAMFEGDQEGAQKALDQIINDSVATALKGRESAIPDEAAIIAKVTPAVEQSLAVSSALRQFQKDFPKVAKDPYLAARADAFLKVALDGGKPIDDAFKEAGEKTLGWMRDTLGLKSEVTVSTARTELTGKKEEIDNVPSTSAKTATPETPVQQDVRSSIDEMRASRVAR